MRVLVTGPGGFVGGALCRRLAGEGHDVVALLRPDRDEAALAQAGVSVARGDLADPETIADAASGCSVVFHTASEGSYRAAPSALSWINVAGTENVLNAARAVDVERVVHLSCADATLLASHRVHWKEDVVLGKAPLGALPRSKLLAEELALQASSAALTVTALRPGWLWGPGDRVNLPGLCREARAGGVRLFGSGKTFLSTTYVDNLVDALIACMAAEGVGGRAFHVADGEFQYAEEFFSALCARLGLGRPRRGVFALSYGSAWLRELRGGAGPYRGEVARRARSCLLDCSGAVTELDFTPRVTLEEGLEALAAWVDEMGGVDAVAKLERTPSDEATASFHQQLADARTAG